MTDGVVADPQRPALRIKRPGPRGERLALASSTAAGTIVPMSVKERLHAAVQAMFEPEAAAALQSLANASGDPVAWMLDHAPPEAPLDDEVAALARFNLEHAAGMSTITADEFRQSLDIT